MSRIGNAARGFDPDSGCPMRYDMSTASPANEAAQVRRKTDLGQRPHPAKEL